MPSSASQLRRVHPMARGYRRNSLWKESIVLASWFAGNAIGGADATPLHSASTMDKPTVARSAAQAVQEVEYPLHKHGRTIDSQVLDIEDDKHHPAVADVPAKPISEREPPAARNKEADDATSTAVPRYRGQLSYMHEREQLASAFRAIAAAGLSAASGLGNHLTMSVPPDYTSFLLNRYGLHWMEVTAENLVLVDAEGNILEGEGPVQGAAVALHGPVHAARREGAQVIFHTHQPWFTSLACVKFGGLRMFHPDACIYADRVGFDPVYTGNWPMGTIVGTLSEGERLLRVPELQARALYTAPPTHISPAETVPAPRLPFTPCSLTLAHCSVSLSDRVRTCASLPTTGRSRSRARSRRPSLIASMSSGCARSRRVPPPRAPHPHARPTHLLHTPPHACSGDALTPFLLTFSDARLLATTRAGACNDVRVSLSGAHQESDHLP